MFVVIHPTVVCVISVSNLTSVADNAMDSTTKLSSSDDVINLHDFVYLINNPELCHQNSERVEDYFCGYTMHPNIQEYLRF